MRGRAGISDADMIFKAGADCIDEKPVLLQQFVGRFPHLHNKVFAGCVDVLILSDEIGICDQILFRLVKRPGGVFIMHPRVDLFQLLDIFAKKL